MFKFVVYAACLVTVFAADSPKTAKVSIVNGTDTTKEIGTLTITQNDNETVITGTIKGLTPGKHGFHIHEKGNITGGCGSTGGHFNPHNKPHGAPDAKERHVGDLGNIVADDKGEAVINIKDAEIKLEGEHSILGLAVVVHQDEDDLGLGNASDSNTTGHAGARVGCGVIAGSATHLQFWSVMVLLPMLISGVTSLMK